MEVADTFFSLFRTEVGVLWVFPLLSGHIVLVKPVVSETDISGLICWIADSELSCKALERGATRRKPEVSFQNHLCKCISWKQVH
jgi:hypothetical protein